MPNIYNNCYGSRYCWSTNVTCEVQQLLGNNRVRVVAMSATDGLMRGITSRIIAYCCGSIAAVLPIRSNISRKKKRKI